MLGIYNKYLEAVYRKVKIINKKNDFLGIKTRWDGLLDEIALNVPFYSWTWYERWWEYFGRGNELFIITVEDSGGELATIASLMKRRSVFKRL